MEMAAMCFATILTSCLLIQTVAGGATITISASDTWAGSVQSSTGLSAPNATWSVSFEVSSPLQSTEGVSVTNATYSLNGVPVGQSIDSVDFWDTSNGGMFDINFSGFPGAGDQIELFGPQIFDAGNNLIPGTYSATIEDYFADSFVGPPTGEGTGTVLVAAVP